MDVSPLNLGMIAAYYYINYTTIGKNQFWSPLPLLASTFENTRPSAFLDVLFNEIGNLGLNN